MNAEIEHRLEAEARHRMDIEGEFASFKNAAMAEKIIAENEVASWKQRCQNLIQRDEHHKQTIHRLERDLYRFQLRKYDMQKAWERREAAASKEAATQERDDVLKRLQRDNEEFRMREEAIAAAVIQRQSDVSTRVKKASLITNVKNFFGMR